MTQPAQLCPVCGNPLDSGVGFRCYTCAARSCLMPDRASSDESVPGGGLSAHRGRLRERFGHFRILSHLGSGGAGSAFEAIDERTGRRVALKILERDLDSEENRARFLREGRLAASIHHPNSVCVYGAEEIDGIPAISMELMGNGTLDSLVKSGGPLPFRRAVDAVLQAAAGLREAASIGVLHRDVKPSNCFLDSDGTVKIGDFGLSISSEASLLKTKAGVLLGTPAFSSPEQLRGERMTIASDIYSLGVTLYYLISGQVPFDGARMIEMLSKALTDPPDRRDGPLREIPTALWEIMAKCLEKLPGQRYQDYETLTRDLARFGSVAPEGARRMHRFAAMVLDCVVVAAVVYGLLALLLNVGWLTPFMGGPIPSDLDEYRTVHRRNDMVWFGVSSLLCVLYFWLQEGIWGRTLGKVVIGLRVVTVHGANPGIFRGFLRALPIVFLLIPGILGFLFDDLAEFTLIYGSNVSYLALSVLFISSRRRNGFAALHDYWSGTRVVNNPTKQDLAPARPIDSPKAGVVAAARLGPFDVLADLTEPGHPIAPDGLDLFSRVGHVLLAHDPKLLRPVWIRLAAPGEPMPVASLQGGIRPALHPWLQGERTPRGGYDAFVGFDGIPFLERIRSPQPWHLVRQWIYDLALEVRARPGISNVAKDNLWITAKGRLVWLEFPAYLLEGRSSGHGVSDAQGPTKVEPDILEDLRETARLALTGTETAPASGVHPPLLPLSARLLLDGNPSVRDLPEFIARLQVCLSTAPRLSAVVRGAMGLITLAVSIYLAVIMWVSMDKFPSRGWGGMAPAVISELHAISAGTLLTRQVEGPGSVERLAAASFQHLGYRPSFLTQLIGSMVLTTAAREELTWICHQNRDVSVEQLRVDEEIVGRLDHKFLRYWLMFPPDYDLAPHWVPARRFRSNVIALLHPLLIVAIPGVLLALTAGGGLVQKCFRLAVVNSDGRPVSRWRILLRSMVLWSPLVAMVIVGLFHLSPDSPDPTFWQLVIGALYPLSCVVGFLSPNRSLVDRLTGTALVPE